MKLQNFNVDDHMIYSALMDSIDDYIYIGDLKTNMYYVSQNMQDDFALPGRLVEDLVHVWGQLIHEKDKGRYYKSIEDMLSGKYDIHNEEYQIKNRQGQYCWVHCHGVLFRDSETGAPLSFIGIVKKPASLGKVDSVTGLLTHEKCQEAIAGMIQDGIFHQGALLLLGIDDFNRINTLKNHQFGDAVLRNMAQDLTRMIPNGSQLYRFDGDQFAILFYDVDKQDLIRVYEQVQVYADQLHRAEDQEYRFTISAGLVCFSDISTVGEDMEKCASIALKEAKIRGKNQYAFFVPQMLDYKVREQKILQELNESVHKNFEGFFLVFQPIVDAASLMVVGAEALLRFQSEAYGSLSPVEFIPLLENSGLIFPVGRWILSQSMKTCQIWRKDIPEFIMNVNVSCMQFKDPRFPAIVEEELKQYDLPPQCITLEMTETYFVTDSDSITAAVDYLHNLGCGIAMDDFGTGYSSLGRLTEFNIDVVKIDRLFVKSLNANNYNHSFVEAVIRLCHSAGMKVCVEGVETEAEQQSVRALYTDTLQGFYLSRPIIKEEFELRFIHHPDVFANEFMAQTKDENVRKALEQAGIRFPDQVVQD